MFKVQCCEWNALGNDIYKYSYLLFIIRDNFTFEPGDKFLDKL